MPRILVDLIHNESYKKIPDSLFSLDYIFDFLNISDPFPLFSNLKKYDLLIIGEIIPSKNQKDHLFLKAELNTMRKYVYNGGKILLTTSSGGDFDYSRTQGSMRALYKVTGVKRFYWGELYCKSANDYYLSPENLVFTEFPNHPIFSNIKKIVLADTTFFELDKDSEVQSILKTKKNMYFNYYADDFKDKMENESIIVANTFGDGKSLTIGSTLFMTNHEKYGIHLADNGKFFKNIIDWLIE